MARDRTETKLGLIHCAATPPSWEGGIAEIHRWHWKRGIYSPRGRSGYHGVIRRTPSVDGRLLELGRHPLEEGAHCLGHNAASVGVCLVGGVEEDGVTPEDNFTPDQWDVLHDVVTFWLSYWPDIAIAGHRDTGARRACPSFDVHDWMVVHMGEAVANENRARFETYMRQYRERRDSR